jgi:hypothetical protein
MATLLLLLFCYSHYVDRCLVEALSFFRSLPDLRIYVLDSDDNNESRSRKRDGNRVIYILLV